MNAQLTELSEKLRANAMQAQSLVWKHTPEQLAARPKPGAWSAAECLCHLTLATEMFLAKWRVAIASARAGGLMSDGPFSTDLIGKMVCRGLQPPTRFRVPAPRQVIPVSVTGDQLPGFLDAQARWLDLVTQADGLALDRVTITTPLLDWIRFSVWSSFCAAEIHQRRHFRQAEQAISQQGSLCPQRNS